MRRALILHPQNRCAAVTRIEVDVARSARGELKLRYVVTGDIAGLALPAPPTPLDCAAPPVPMNCGGHTCLEAFAADEGGYGEFNFAPSLQWAAYRFDGYRAGMRPAETPAPRIETRASADALEMVVSFAVPVRDLRLGLCAVIEERSGALSYWALAHPRAAPDFHHPDSFILSLPAMDAA